MKKIIYSIALSIAFIPASAGNRSSLSFDTYEWDFGAIDARISSQLTELENKILEVSPVKNIKRQDPLTSAE